MKFLISFFLFLLPLTTFSLQLKDLAKTDILFLVEKSSGEEFDSKVIKTDLPFGKVTVLIRPDMPWVDPVVINLEKDKTYNLAGALKINSNLEFETFSGSKISGTLIKAGTEPFQPDYYTKAFIIMNINGSQKKIFIYDIDWDSVKEEF